MYFLFSGVEVSEMDMQEKKKILFFPAGAKVTFQVWDFAGQKDFHLMHMCFLPSIGLYILVFNLMDGEPGIKVSLINLHELESKHSIFSFRYTQLIKPGN